MNYFELPAAYELSLLITLLRASKDLLMFWPSRSLIPSACVLLTPSDPAKSTKFNWETFILPRCWIRDDVLVTLSCEQMLMRNTVWLLELSSFSLVAAIFLNSSPCCMYFITSSKEDTFFSDSLLIQIPFWIVSLTSKFLFYGSIKSLTHSLYISK